jgi:hypothetical protein
MRPPRLPVAVADLALGPRPYWRPAAHVPVPPPLYVHGLEFGHDGPQMLPDERHGARDLLEQLPGRARRLHDVRLLAQEFLRRFSDEQGKKIEGIADIRNGLITLRNGALDQGQMSWAVILSHAIALLSTDDDTVSETTDVTNDDHDADRD